LTNPTISSSTLQLLTNFILKGVREPKGFSFLRLQRAFTPTHGQRNIKHESTTMAIRNLGKVLIIKFVALKILVVN